MRKLFRITVVGNLLNSLSAFFLAFIASLHSSVNHGFLVRLEFVEVLGIHLLAMLVSVSV